MANADSEIANSVVGDRTTPLKDLVDTEVLQSMMLDFYEITSIPMSLVDDEGNVLVGAGWQRVCTDFHRVNDQTCSYCLESDTVLTADIPAGKAEIYRCKNGMWDAATPVVVEGKRVGQVFTGQFFFDDETIDLEFFRRQAAKYGFEADSYIKAVMDVPRLSRHSVETGLRFLTKLATLISEMGLSNIQREALLEEERLRARRLEVLQTLTTLVTSSLDVASVIEKALEQIEVLLGVTASSVWLLGDERLDLAGARGFPQRFFGDFVDGLGLETGYEVVKAFTANAVISHGDVTASDVSPDVLRAYARYGIDIRSLVAVPLRSASGPMGGLTLAWEAPRVFTADDLAFDLLLADTCAIGLQNASTYEKEHQIAAVLQETLIALPTHVPGVAFSSAYESSSASSGNVGGDFVDVFEVDEQCVGVVAGDVSGKGIEAAVITSLVRDTVRAHTLDGASPGDVCGKTNRVICRFTKVEGYVTIFFGLLNTRTGLLRYVSAGHPPALLVSGGDVTVELPAKGPILGAFYDARYHESQTVLGHGERLVLYTDGVTEARSPALRQFYELDGLRRSLCENAERDTSALAAGLMDDVVRFSNGVLRDDAAILVVEPLFTPDELPPNGGQ